MTVMLSTIFKRLLGFTSVGVVVFPLELALATLLIELFDMPYLWALGISFVIAISLAYRYYRKLSFYNSDQGQVLGYIYFMLLALAGLAIAMTGSYWLVETYALHPTVARGLMGVITGLCNFTINLVYNFKVLSK